MNNLELIAKFVNFLKNEPKDVAYGTLLSDISELTPEDKNIIMVYLFPNPLADGEFPVRLRKMREAKGTNRFGEIFPVISDVAAIVEASRTEQYSRFIYLLFRATSDVTKIFPVQGTEECNCALCKKKLFQYEAWENKLNNSTKQNNEREERKFLAFRCDTGNSLSLCLPCIIQIKKASEIVKHLRLMNL